MGADFHPNLVNHPFEAVFDKGEYAAAYSGFEGASAGVDLATWLDARGVESVDVCGIATDYCVRATAIDAAAAGFTTRVLLELTAAVAPDRLPLTTQALQEAGVELVRQWLEAGVMEDGRETTTLSGTPLGGVILPLLCNIYLGFLDYVWKKRCADLGVLVR